MEVAFFRAAPTKRPWSWKALLLILMFVALFVVDGKEGSSEFNANSSGLGKYNSTHPWSRRSRKLSMIHKHLRKINKPAIKSIQSPDGDIIDCIHLHKQPAFDHPLLKNHKVKDLPERPSRFPGRVNGTNFSSVHPAQTWHLSGYCPEGTIPVRRTTEEDLMRAESPQKYGRKSHVSKRFSQKPDVINGNGHEHAIAYVEGDEYYGAKATINVWSPKIETMGEFSLSQIWVLSGSFDGWDLNSIEAGWQVSPELYGDSRPRLFTYWTTDSYKETGCYNLLCSGFVQTNNKIAIGAAISPVSKFSSTQYDITMLIWKDPKQGNWWMEFADSTLVGYWPSELFSHLADHASMVEWGGEVVNSEPGGKHTSTQMGSGHFAEEGFGRASYFRNIELVDADNSLRPVDAMSTLAEHTNCYNIHSTYNSDWGNHFYFGGPGSNSGCS
ncbi:protein neprosin [Cryptomeria japonica]|uniref:protein neprosin n=1 Tax=Cryptomeria japonica TaxID=3369 RepID=UPI0027DA802D|nr:protein neprosin [Cryptomeria japonica]